MRTPGSVGRMARVAFVVAGLAVFSCDDALVDPASSLGNIELLIVLEAGQVAASDGESLQSDGALMPPPIDGGRVRITAAGASSSTTINLTLSGNQLSGEATGLAVGNYTVVFEGTQDGMVTYYGTTTGVTVRKDETAPANITASSFVPEITPFVSPTTSFSSTLDFTTVLSATGYQVEVANNAGFTGSSQFAAAGPGLALPPTSDTGLVFVRVRAMNDDVAASDAFASDPESFRIIVDTLETPEIGADTIDANIFPATEVDSFTVELFSGQFLTVDVTSRSALMPVLAVFDPDGNPVAADSSGMAAALDSLPILEDGIYLVTVAASGGTVGDYSLDADVAGESPVDSVAVTPAAPSMGLNDTLQLTAEGLNVTGNPVSGVLFSWTSSDPNRLSIDSNGVAIALDTGLVTVTATSLSDVDGTTDVSVILIVNTVTVLASADTLTSLGDTLQLGIETRDPRDSLITGLQCTWDTSDPALATIDSVGLLTAAGNGDATMTATCLGTDGLRTFTIDQVPVTATVSVDADSLSSLDDTTSVTGLAFDANTNPIVGAAFTWVISDSAVVSVDSIGIVTALDNGLATLTGSFRGVGAQDSVVVQQVTDSVSVVAGLDSLPSLGDTTTVTAAALDANDNPIVAATFTWYLSDSAVATIDTAGLLTAIDNGHLYIGTAHSGVAGSTAVDIQQVAASIGLSTSADTLVFADTTTIGATAFDANGNAVAGAVLRWRSSDTTVVGVDSTSGLATAAASGLADLVISDSASGTADSAAMVVLYRVAGVGANSGLNAAAGIFSSGDLPGSFVTIDEFTFNALTPAALRAAFDVLIFTWFSSPGINADWTTRLLPYMALGGGVIWEDEQNVGDLAPAIVAVESNVAGSFNVASVVPGLTDGITNDFVNSHVQFVTLVDPALSFFITFGADIVGAYGRFGAGCIVLTGPDSHFHGQRGGFIDAANMYNLLLNSVRFVGNCPLSTPATAGPPAQVAVSLNSTTFTQKADTVRILASVVDSTGAPLGLAPAWSSTAPLVADVDPTGLAISVAPGTADITASAGGVSASTAITVNAQPATIYVANDVSGDVSVISSTTNSVTSTIPVGTSPTGVAVTPNGSFTYVANSLSDNISVIANVTNTVVATIPATNPFDIDITPNGAFAYVAQFSANSVVVIATSTNAVVTTIPVGISPIHVRVSPDGSTVYAANLAGGTISVISTASNTVTGTISADLPLTRPAGMTITRDGSFLYVGTQFSSEAVAVIETATNTVVDSIFPATGNLYEVASSPVEDVVFAANAGGNEVNIIETATNAITATTPVPGVPAPIAATPDGFFVYVGSNASNTVTVLETATWTVVTTIVVGNNPRGIDIR